MELQIKEIIETQGELIPKVLSEQQEKHNNIIKIFLKAIIVAFISIVAICLIFASVLIYQAYQAYNYDGAGVKVEGNGSITTSTANNGTINNNKDNIKATALPIQK